MLIDFYDFWWLGISISRFGDIAGEHIGVGGVYVASLHFASGKTESVRAVIDYIYDIVVNISIGIYFAFFRAIFSL